MKILYYDTETTGLNHMKHSIIEIAGLIEIDGKVAETFEFKVRPHEKAKIEEAALAANGHKFENLPHYPQMSRVMQLLLEILDKYVSKYDKKDKFFLAGFNNAAFDDRFFRMFFELCGNRFFGSYFWKGSLDVMILAAHKLMDTRHAMPSFKLHRVAKTLGLDVADEMLHGALYDAQLTREVYLELKSPENCTQIGDRHIHS